MKVLLISKFSKSGGAGIASRRLLYALEHTGISVRLLTHEDPGTGPMNLIHAPSNPLENAWAFFLLAVERLSFVLHEKSRQVRFLFSMANVGSNIARNNLVRNADIIHLHWINSGMLSLRGLRRIMGLNKPILWTFHDMWAITGGCHVPMDCERYKDHCGECPFLRVPSPGDLSHRLWKRKKKLFEGKKLVVVTCSKWLKD